MSRNGFKYLIACTLKSGHEYKNDWSKPGKVYAAVLPESLDGYDEGHQLKLEVVKDGMLKNHGYYRIGGEEGDTCLIACDSGVYQFIPPEAPGKAWEIRASDRGGGQRCGAGGYGSGRNRGAGRNFAIPRAAYLLLQA